VLDGALASDGPRVWYIGLRALGSTGYLGGSRTGGVMRGAFLPPPPPIRYCNAFPELDCALLIGAMCAGG
jgi:hypothetical protein